MEKDRVGGKEGKGKGTRGNGRKWEGELEKTGVQGRSEGGTEGQKQEKDK